MKIRGSTQIADDSIVADNFEPGVRALINRTWARRDFIASNGQTVLTNPQFNINTEAEVRINGIVLMLNDYQVGEGEIILDDPLENGDVVTVMYGTKLAPGLELDGGSF